VVEGHVPSLVRWLEDEAHRAVLRDEAGALVRLGAVAHHVAQAPQLADARALDVGEDRLEGGQVRVNVAQDGQSHDETSGLS
jgi:hypothetical protein